MCCVSYVTGASNWDWLTVWKGLLSLQQARVEGECFYFFCFFVLIHFPLSPLSLSFISSTISSIAVLWRRHKMTHNGWHVVKPQHNQSFSPIDMHNRCFWLHWYTIYTPASVVPLDARPTGDQEVAAGLTPAGSATFFRGGWSWNIFYGYSLPSADSRRAIVCFWRKNVHNTG